jgi:hypothetical protein
VGLDFPLERRPLRALALGLGPGTVQLLARLRDGARLAGLQLLLRRLQLAFELVHSLAELLVCRLQLAPGGPPVRRAAARAALARGRQLHLDPLAGEQEGRST